MNVKVLALAFAGILAASPGLAGSFKGKVVAHDRVAHRLVLEDKSVVLYDAAKIKMPDDLKAGDTVEVVFSGAEGDLAVVDSIKVVKQ